MTSPTDIEYSNTIHSLELRLLDISTCLDREIEEHERHTREYEDKMAFISVKIDEIVRLMKHQAERTE
jgi:hypothetical protein